MSQEDVNFNFRAKLNPEGPELTAAERELERALGGLTPAAAGFSRDDLMFAAGRAAAGKGEPRRALRCWQGVAAGLAAALTVSVLYRPGPAVQTAEAPAPAERVAVNETPRPETTNAMIAPVAAALPWAGRGFSPESYLGLRQAVLTHGVSALPRESGAGGGGGAELDPEMVRDLPAWQRRGMSFTGGRS